MLVIFEDLTVGCDHLKVLTSEDDESGGLTCDDLYKLGPKHYISTEQSLFVKFTSSGAI